MRSSECERGFLVVAFGNALFTTLYTMDPCLLVKDTCRAVAEQSEHVKIDAAALNKMAESLVRHARVQHPSRRCTPPVVHVHARVCSFISSHVALLHHMFF